ncbi:MFS general substrate transporter [Mycena venus]|uniref:MFS general substrate transporter n=1 Tax=Mycena venus TaxID=2733690 RepID=A0A8H6YB69_9AGAR|nr:MFS general substrate transporter [Mycena venus]
MDRADSTIEKGTHSVQPSLQNTSILRPDRPEERYLKGFRLFQVYSGFLITVLLITLDQTIVATALPQIVSHFNALNDVTWPVTAYFLTQGGLILFVGQVLKLFPKKTVYLSSTALFEIGSLICALANSMPLFIVGRAIAGCGAAGIQMSVATLTPEITPLEKRPVLYATFGGVLGLSAVLGPLLGGTFTDKVSWRWCFWINLPCGAVGAAVVFFLLKIHPQDETQSKHKWMHLDWAGAVLMLGSFASFLLPLQWGGNVKAWNNPTVIALFAVSAALLLIFLVWERRLSFKAMVPLRLLARRTQVGGAVAGFLGYLAMLLVTYYLPLWYQARGQTAIQSGLSILPYLISLVVAAGVAGAIVTKFGNYWWFLFLCPITTAVAGGLLFTLRAETPTAHLIGFQILYGIGIGATFQNVLLAVQVDFADDEDMIPQATAFVSFTQILGGIVGIAVAGSIFANRFRHYLDIFASDLPPDARAAVLQTVTVIKLLPLELKNQVVEAYARGLGPIFLLSVVAAILSSLSTLLIANVNIHTRAKAISESRATS